MGAHRMPNGRPPDAKWETAGCQMEARRMPNGSPPGDICQPAGRQMEDGMKSSAFGY